jgi:hypothetical protein
MRKVFYRTQIPRQRLIIVNGQSNGQCVAAEAVVDATKILALNKK